ncbi:alpha/beta fold hydrolase [Jidongwangia harbinensis]|uniref:alpha/beta fold hydrolase n=1 Tax=Jidongwangia harbinensis TaxID=2878561 RepID=UPI001CD9F111|nr:alpha/beta fold hydrolase [Jidongwangia harbinensis]MCA2211561.1 alpha/beta fold hydrolase [Jidongwangia harbinensis]
MTPAHDPSEPPADETSPPLRSTHTYRGLAYDRWGSGGRPVLLLHGVLFDRRLWWPAAAEIAGDCTVIAPDLPGHGETPARPEDDPGTLAADLAAVVSGLALRRAPVVVGHATSVHLAHLFAGRYASRAVVAVDELTPAPGDTPEHIVAAMGGEHVPGVFQPFAVARRDPALLRAYRCCWAAGPPPAADLTVLSRPGAGDNDDDPGDGRVRVYRSRGRFAHLHQVRRFAEDLRSLL